LLGIDNIMWSTDFPHPVTSWPRSREIIDDIFREVPADERAAILSGNAARVWQL
jgi:predicted TIM-barrel fold metal-dependent hydrolase